MYSLSRAANGDRSAAECRECAVADASSLDYNCSMKRHDRWLIRCMLIALAALLLPLLSVPSARTARSRNSDPGLGANVTSDLGVRRTSEMGFDWVRVYFPDQVQEAERRGLNVLLLLGWEEPLSDVGSWGHHVYDIVSRYRGRIAAYQICNEPNLAEMWHRPRHAEPAEYVMYLREAYLRAKEADPDCIIVTAGLAVNGGAGDLAMDDLQFLRGMYAAGARPYFDVLGAHPYGFGYAPEDATSNVIHCFRRVEQYRTAMEQYGDSGKSVWATEVGWIIEPSAQCRDYPGWSGWWWQTVSAQTQGDYLVRAYRYARMYWPWMGVMFVWNMDYDLVPWNDYCDHKAWFALLNHDGTPRPAYLELAGMALGNQEPTAAPTLTATSPPVITPTATSAPGTGTVSGQVSLQGRNDHQGAHIALAGRSSKRSQDGSFHIDRVPAGTQTLTTSMVGYLRHRNSDVLVHAGQSNLLPALQLRDGDINADDTVSLLDLVAISSRFGTTGPLYAEDLNADGQVNLFDLVLVSTNYGKTVSDFG